MPSSVIPFPPPSAEEHGRAETERKQGLFDWADRVLRDVGLAERVMRANSLDELRKITFDPNAAEVALAIREALHPVTGAKHDCFAGLRADGLKRILRMRFDEMKKQREAQLRRGRHGGSQQSAPDWTEDLKLDGEGGVRPILHNLILYLRHHAKWKGVLAYDEFSARVVIRKRPPWGKEAPDTHCTDHHESLTRVWFQREDINAALGDVGRAVEAAARSNPYHPVRQYLESLEWDGIPRLDTWLITHCHADDTTYTRAVGRRFPISAVARIYEPGCKVDTMPIFEGPQGKQKSETLRTLAVRDDWFTDRLSHIASKDATIETAGIWLIEVAEMDALTRASPSAMKQFVTRRFERFRPPYGKRLIIRGRQCVFAGTINPQVGGYLKDPTGNRRFWPVACQGMIDLDGIKRDRDQLWAEAVHRYKTDEKWWMDTPELEALAAAEQAARFKTDIWKEPVERWLARHRRKVVSLSEVLKGALGIAPLDQSRSAQMRVVTILTSMGFRKYRGRNGSKRPNLYRQEQS